MDKYKSDHSIKSDQKKHLQDISRSIETNKEIQKKFIQATSELNLLKKRQKNLIHDLRGPLFGITGMIDLMITNGEEELKIQIHDLHIIRESAQSLMDLVNSTPLEGDTYKSLNRTMNFDRTLFSAIVEINRLYLPLALNKGVSLSLSNQTDAEIMLSPNFFNNLIQIIGNLVANAIKFTPAGGSVDVCSTMDTEENQSMLYITVTDTGKGMSSDQVSAFNRGKPVSISMGTDGEKGFGIGLQHVQEMVSEGTGHIEVKSKEGTGTTFSLSFPLSDLNFIRESTDLSAAATGFVSVNGHQK
jgi:signal transduction histidine kinase